MGNTNHSCKVCASLDLNKCVSFNEHPIKLQIRDYIVNVEQYKKSNRSKNNIPETSLKEYAESP